ncbi:MAG: hypothetical protein GX633_06010, partial [Clostridiales bacterium]|nr:hypothetical protein [Clostridiales bacterium]
MFYFDCTGFYGSGSHEKPDYPTLQSFIDELDRLGINCALTTHASARDNHCFVGNRQLMADIEAIPGAENRIIPAFAVAPKNFYERENMEYLIEMLSSGRVGALSIYPGSDRFSITHLERLFDKISCYSPVVLLDCFEIMDGRNGNNAFGYESLITVAKKYPNMPFIIRDGMWGDCGYIFDAMWRCDNIYADISRLHVQDIIPNIRRNIGLGRVVFGSGYRALCGASIAALRYSGENEAEQRRIAGERLMSLMPNKDEMKRLRKNLTELTPMTQNRFWTEYLRGEGIRSYEIIDVHTHLS